MDSVWGATAVPAGSARWIEADFTGPGKLYFEFFKPNGNTGAVTGAAEGLCGYNVPAGLQTVRWTITQPAALLTATATLDQIIYRPATTWSGWQTSNFAASTPAAQMAFDADPDLDGLANGMEAALGTHPQIADTAPPLRPSARRIPIPTWP